MAAEAAYIRTAEQQLPAQRCGPHRAHLMAAPGRIGGASKDSFPLKPTLKCGTIKLDSVLALAEESRGFGSWIIETRAGCVPYVVAK